MSSQQVSLTQGQWIQITTTDKDGSIRHHSGQRVVYLESATIPPAFSPATPVMETTTIGDSWSYFGVASSDFVWALAISSDAVIVVTATSEA